MISERIHACCLKVQITPHLSGTPEFAEYRHAAKAELEEDRWVVVERWLALIPEDISKQRPTILIAKALVASAAQRFDQLISFTNEAELLIADGKGSRGQEGELNFQGNC